MSVSELTFKLDKAFESKEKIDPGVLFQIMQEHKLYLDEMEKYTYFEKKTQYTRNLVHETENYSLLLLCWNPGSTSAIHTHANSQCWAKVVHGEVTEVVYEDLESRKVKKNTCCRPGSVLYIDDSLGVHRICNETEKPAMSLHCYYPPIRECNFFCIKTQHLGKTKMSNFSEYGKLLKDTEYFHYKFQENLLK